MITAKETDYVRPLRCEVLPPGAARTDILDSRIRDINRSWRDKVIIAVLAAVAIACAGVALEFAETDAQWSDRNHDAMQREIYQLQRDLQVENRGVERIHLRVQR